MSNNNPIFVHSLFRAGSTYIFKMFRRIPGAYYCFQEALHEVPLSARDAAEDLIGITSETTAHIRHPSLDAAYFQELYDIHSHWAPVLEKPMVYDDYFNGVSEVDSADYFAALIKASPRRPLFQECRTCGRIGSLKEKLGGYHIHLWRNPWDQWWSYKATDYFDTASLMFLNAANPPEAIRRLRERLNFAPFHRGIIAEEFEHFYSVRLGATESYLLFYTLWSLALHEAINHADGLLNIDTLSQSPEARADQLKQVASADIGDLSLEDCKVPQAIFGSEERGFFEQIEDIVCQQLLAPAIGEQALSAIRALRLQHRPETQRPERPSPREADVLRALLRRSEEREFDRVRRFRQALDESREQERSLGHRLQRVSQQRVQEKGAHQRRVAQLKGQLDTLGQRLEQVSQQRALENSARERQVADLEAHVGAIEQQLQISRKQRQALRQSWSWKMTYPVRWAGDWWRRLRADS